MVAVVGYNNISVNVDEFTVADVTLSQPTNHNIQVRGKRALPEQRFTMFICWMPDSNL